MWLLDAELDSAAQAPSPDSALADGAVAATGSPTDPTDGVSSGDAGDEGATPAPSRSRRSSSSVRAGPHN